MRIGSNTAPSEMLQVDGAILLGNTSNTNLGTIRWNGTDFQGYTASGWVSLNSQGAIYSAGTGLSLAGNTFSLVPHTGDVTGTTALTIANNAVTIAKLPAGATASTFLRGDGTWAVPSAGTYTAGTGLNLSGTTFSHAAHTGDVTGADVLTIAANAVTNAKLADMAASTIKGRITSTGDPQDLTTAQVLTMLGLSNALTGTGNTNKVAFWTGATTLDDDNDLHWNSTDNLLGIGNNSPVYHLDVKGTGIPAGTTTSTTDNILGRFEQTTPARGAGIQIRGYRNTSGNEASFIDLMNYGSPNNTDYIVSRVAALRGAGDAGSLLFYTNTGSGITEKMRISDAGTVTVSSLAGSGGNRFVQVDNLGNLSYSNVNPATAGTVTSVGLSMPSGFSVGASPVTSSGTLAVTTTLSGPIKGNGSGFTAGAIALNTSEVSGTLPIANGGTNSTASPTAGSIAYGSGTAYAFTAAGTAGQVLSSNGAGAPTWADAGALLTAGTGISIAGNTINSVWTASGNNIQNNNTANVGIGTAPATKLHVSSNGATMRLQGTDHTYIELYPDGPATRKGYLGFPSGADDNLTITNEIANNNIRLNTTGTGKVELNSLSGTGSRPVYASSTGQLITYDKTSTTRANFTTVTTGTSWVVPAGVHFIRVLLVGGGGGSGYYALNTNVGSGGAGGFVQGSIPVTPGETLTIVVGAGGTAGGNNGGGGRGSAIRRGSTILAAAGGGGGGSYNGSAYWGFGGGRSYGTGIDGTNAVSANVNHAGGANNIDYLHNAISLVGTYGQTGNNYNYVPEFVYSTTEVDQNFNYGRGGRGSYGDAGVQGAVFISY